MSKPSPSSPVCPWWLIRTFDNPVRRLVHNPERLLKDLVRPGDACVDIGCGIGYFTIPLARLAGPSGSVTAVDLQPEMLAGVERRAEKAGVRERIRLQQADASGLHLEDAFDFALTFWMVHEVPDQAALLRQIQAVLKPGGRLLMVEPIGHVPRAAYAATVSLAARSGFSRERDVRVAFSRAALWRPDSGAECPLLTGSLQSRPIPYDSPWSTLAIALVRYCDATSPQKAGAPPTSSSDSGVMS